MRFARDDLSCVLRVYFCSVKECHWTSPLKSRVSGSFAGAEPQSLKNEDSALPVLLTHAIRDRCTICEVVDFRTHSGFVPESLRRAGWGGALGAELRLDPEPRCRLACVLGRRHRA